MDCENASYPLFDLFLTILPFHVPGSHAFIITAPPCYEISAFVVFILNGKTVCCIMMVNLLLVSLVSPNR
jgi:hypothetical protein